MLRPRIIPCLLLSGGGLVKTVRFSRPKYVGDPLNAVRIFNEKVVDELMVIDIDATKKGYVPDMELIAALAGECRMPFAYGGGVKTVQHIEQLVGVGVEKVCVSSVALEDGSFIPRAVERVGRQSIVGVMDVKRTGVSKRLQVFTHNGLKPTGMSPVVFAKMLQSMGVGEILVNCADRDGTMLGYDLELAAIIKDATSVPLTFLGGAGSLTDIKDLFAVDGFIGAGVGSLFTFSGRFRSVLLSYPDPKRRAELYPPVK